MQPWLLAIATLLGRGALGSRGPAGEADHASRCGLFTPIHGHVNWPYRAEIGEADHPTGS